MSDCRLCDIGNWLPINPFSAHVYNFRYWRNLFVSSFSLTTWNYNFWNLPPSSCSKIIFFPLSYSFHIYPQEPVLLTPHFNLFYPFNAHSTFIFPFISFIFNPLYYFFPNMASVDLFPHPFWAGGNLYFRCISSCSLSSGGRETLFS